MDWFISRIRKPVKREGAQVYLRFTLISFALSIIATRVYLTATGFPQVGGGDFHIAHVLWGGLFLFAASLLPLVFSNRSIYTISAIFSGVGVGLFIDEVGKFITTENDYFYPAAAPIIYAIFVLTVLLYSQIKRPPSGDTRGELYRALDSLEEILDHDLNEEEHKELVRRLEHIEKDAKNPEFARLATSLLEFLHSRAVKIVDEDDVLDKVIDEAEMIEKKLVKKSVLRVIVTAGLAISSIITLSNLVTLIYIAVSESYFLRLLNDLKDSGLVTSDSTLSFFLARLTLDALVGVVLAIAVVFLLADREKHGINIGYFGLLASLTTTNLLVFYFDQFSAIVGATLQFALLIAVIRYRELYINPSILKRKKK